MRLGSCRATGRDRSVTVKPARRLARSRVGRRSSLPSSGAGSSEAYDRARFSARKKADLIAASSATRRKVCSSRRFHRAESVRDDVDASFSRDPRSLSTDELKKISLDASHEVAALGDAIAFQVVAAMTELRHEIFIDTARHCGLTGVCVFAGRCYVVAQIGDGHQESYDSIGQQRGLECLSDGWRGELMPNPSLAKFCVDLATEARELAAAPVLKPPDGEVVVVTDPHFNALVSHEVIGHPCEADRALKMEAAYAGRSWFLRSLADNQMGKRSRRRCCRPAPIRGSTATATIATTTKARAGAA